MIRTLLATSALATLVASGAMAQTMSPSSPTAGPATQAAPEQPMVKHAEGHLASGILGKSVYNGTGDDAENIGKVSDLVIDDKGDIKAIVVGVGGFLGIGQKNVALKYDLVEWKEQDDREWLVVETTADALKAQPEFDAKAYEPMPADADVSETKPATKEDLANAPKPDENATTDDQGAAATDGGTAGTDSGAATTGDNPPAADSTDTGATSGDQSGSSATGTDTEKPAADTNTDTGSETAPKNDTAE